jgi:hypothetical protein
MLGTHPFSLVEVALHRVVPLIVAFVFVAAVRANALCPIPNRLPAPAVILVVVTTIFNTLGNIDRDYIITI